MVFLLFVQYHVRTGYELSRCWWYATDCVMWLAMLLTSLGWTAVVLFSTWSTIPESPEEQYCYLGYGWLCLGRMAFIPWILLITSICWAAAGLLQGKFYAALHRISGSKRMESLPQSRDKAYDS